MFLTGPPGAAGSTLRISRSEHRIVDGSSALATDPAMRAYLTDMVAPYGLALREELIESGSGHSYGELAEPLLEAVLPDGAPVDLLVLAYGVHDIRLGRATATYLSSRCPGNPLAFAVCDQGTAAAFSALKLINAYAATGACERALLIVAEQPAVHYELAAPVPVPDRNAAVALVLEAGGEPVEVRQHAQTKPDQADALLAKEIAGMSGAITVILGGGLKYTESTVDDLRVGPAGQPYTGVWCALSAGLPDWAGGRQVLVADYDAALGYFCTAAMGMGGR
jgi:hypothetical protein